MPVSPPRHRPAGWEAPAQRRAAYARERGSPSARGYDRLWEKFRRSVLAGRPLCEDHLLQAKPVPATEVHHVEKVRDAPHRRLDPANVMSLCKSCHSIRTSRGE